MHLVESFLSIQGEGKYAGHPSLFVRFGGCNLTCKDFGCEFISPLDGSKLVGCDSLYAVSGHFKNEWERFENAHELFAQVISHVKNIDYLPHLVITGGEPLIHYKNSVFYGFLELALSYGFDVFFETNASVEIDFDRFDLYKKIGFCMSVKLSNSGEPYEKRVNKKAIQNIAAHSKEAFFKFVLDKQTLKTNVKKEIEDIILGCNIPIFCMPLGKKRAEISKNASAVALFCVKNGYNYSDRIHINLWGDRKGV